VLSTPDVVLVLAGVAAGSARDDVVREGVAGTFPESLNGVAVVVTAVRLLEAAEGVALALPLSVERTSIVARLEGRPGVDSTPELDIVTLARLSLLLPLVGLLPLTTLSSRESGLGFAGLSSFSFLVEVFARVEDEAEAGLEDEVEVERGGETGGERAEAGSFVRDVEVERETVVEVEEEVGFDDILVEVVWCLVGTREDDPGCGKCE